jgi:hypothetical protein
MSDTPPSEIKHNNYELFMLGVALLSLFNLVLGLLTYNIEQRMVVVIMDFILSLILMGDFLYRLISAPQRREYFFRGMGWLDLLGSLPYPWLRLFRLFRIVRLLRMLRKAGIQNLQTQAVEHTANSLMFGVMFLVILVIELGSYAILGVEPYSVGGNIQTASDALWWSVVTIATVGYGDYYPVTNVGRLIGIGVIVSGVGLFSVLTSYLAQGFIRRRQRQADQRRGSQSAGGDELPERLAHIERLLAEHEALTASLHKELAELTGKRRRD